MLMKQHDAGDIFVEHEERDAVHHAVVLQVYTSALRLSARCENY